MLQLKRGRLKGGREAIGGSRSFVRADGPCEITVEMDSGESEDGEDFNIFEEPKGFYQAEKEPTFVSHTTENGHKLVLRLIGSSPLWGHLLWNAGHTLATYLETHSIDLVANKSVLELGAGAGLPSLICALNGARNVVVTDYPDPELISNLQYNIDANRRSLSREGSLTSEGYLWGAPIEHLTAHLPEAEREQGFDLLILADLLFNHSEHQKLLATIQRTMKRSQEAQALVVFTPYRPWLLEQDLSFFELARKEGLIVEKIFEEVMESVMFEDDPGDELLRRTVFGYRVRWPAEAESRP